MTDDIVIEQLKPDDYERARTIRLRALRDDPDAFWTAAEEEEQRTPDQWRERLGAVDAATFVARRGDADVGLVVGAPHHAHDGDAGLFSMWVAPQARRAGVAEALVRRVIAWASDGGFRNLQLEVADANVAAVRLYERLGFVDTGDTGRFPPPREHITEHRRSLDLSARTQRRQARSAEP